MNESIPKKIDTPEETLHRELDAFIDERNYTSTELEQGYYYVLGDESIKMTPRTLAIADKLLEFERQGYPIAKFIEHINIGRHAEATISELTSTVQNLPITEEERQLLLNIAQDGRKGTLQILSGDTEIASRRTDLFNSENHIHNAFDLTEHIYFLTRKAREQGIENFSFVFKED